jgi:hypothetical protein
VCTTYRLTEHYLAGAMSRWNPWLTELQPELFIELSPELAGEKGIRNHTTGFGFSAGDILRSGISLYGNYNLNRGDASEADTYYISASRSFGKLSWSLSYANFYNGVRFDAHGTPQVVRIELPDQRTFSSDWFLAFNRGLAVALDYSYLRQAGLSEHQFFVRLILRK